MHILLISQDAEKEAVFKSAARNGELSFFLTTKKDFKEGQAYFVENEFDLLFFDTKSATIVDFDNIVDAPSAPPIICLFDQVKIDLFDHHTVIDFIPSSLLAGDGLSYCVKNVLRLIQIENNKISTEKKLAKTEDRLGAIIANTPLALFLVDKQSTIKFGVGLLWDTFNAGLNLLGQNIAIGFEQSPHIVDAYTKCLNGKAQTTNYRIAKVVFEVTFSPIFGSENELKEVIVLALDISAQEKGILSLRQSKIIAENASRLKQEFIANISHDIRTPMNAIVGFSDLLKETKLTTLQSDFVQAISTSSSNLVELVNDVLDYSKIEAGEIEIQENVFSIKKLIDELISVLQVRAREKRNKINVVFDAEIPELLIGDKLKVYQILSNLVGNAIKYTENGVINIKLSLLKLTNEVAKVVFDVQDDGIGISVAGQKKVFNAFTRDTPALTATNSTGLGLTIVKRIVTALEGEIGLVSTLGEGSTFTVALEFNLATELPKEKYFDEDDYKKHLKDKRILLVEDNEMNQKLVIMYLHRFDVKIDLAENGVQAVKAAKRNLYDVVLMDIEMPEMDGKEAVKSIRRSGNKVPVLAMTAHAFKDEVTSCYDAGMDAHIAKPIDKALFLKTILKLLTNKDISIGNNQGQVNLSARKTARERIVDLDYLEEMSGGNKAFILQMLGVFEKDAPDLVQRMKNAFDSRDWCVLSRIAHKYRSPAVMLGMKGAAKIAADIEYFDFDNGKIENIENLIAKVAVQNENAIAFIQAYVNE